MPWRRSTSLRTTPEALLQLVRLSAFQSFHAGMQAVCHDITALLAMAGEAAAGQ